MGGLRASAPVSRIFALVFAATTIAAACAKASGPVVVLRPGDDPVRVRVELALTTAERTRGLMWRDHMDADAGMLFAFPDSKPRSFWMKNTPLPLDILFIGPDGVVVAVAEDTKPYSLAPIPSGKPAKYVLEVNAGFARKHGLSAGTRAVLPELPAG